MARKPPLPPKKPPARLVGADASKAGAVAATPRARSSNASAAGSGSLFVGTAAGSSSPRIARAGVYDGIPIEVYHGDLCAGPSMSSSMAIAMVKMSPEKAHYRSYLNPERPDDDSPATIIAQCAHALILEGKEGFDRIAIVQPSFSYGWEGKAQRREFEKMCRARKPAPFILTRSEFETVRLMRDAMDRNRSVGARLRAGVKERTLIWRDAETGIWCKSRPDVQNIARDYALDYKTVPDTHPDAFETHAWRMGYHQQGAWALEGFKALGLSTDGLRWEFATQEREPPFAIGWGFLNRDNLEIGRELNRRARIMWAECLKRGEWPGYRSAEDPTRDLPFEVAPPRWAYVNHETRREVPRTAMDIANTDLLRRMMAAQAPLDGGKK